MEIHANLLVGILNGELQSVPAGHREVEALLMLVAGLIVVFAVPWRRPVLSVLGIVGVALVVVAINMGFWFRAQSVVPLAATLLMLLALLMWNLASGFLRESRAIRSLSDMFGEYVPRERVAQMRETGERFSMEGESRELTVLFSDVRNFTTVSEQLPPRELSALMNAYLTPMTAVIHDHHGTIDKYIGDAIMAFWGAPLPNPRHPHDAVAAALGMQKAMRELGEGFAQRGWPPLAIGIGLNTGADERRRHGLGVSQGVHGAGRRGESGRAARGPDQGLQRGHPVRRGDAPGRARFPLARSGLGARQGPRPGRRDLRAAAAGRIRRSRRGTGAMARGAGALSRAAVRATRSAAFAALAAAHPDARPVRGLPRALRRITRTQPPPPDWDGANTFLTEVMSGAVAASAACRAGAAAISADAFDDAAAAVIEVSSRGRRPRRP